jgi:hypothetical protein
MARPTSPFASASAATSAPEPPTIARCNDWPATHHHVLVNAEDPHSRPSTFVVRWYTPYRPGMLVNTPRPDYRINLHDLAVAICSDVTDGRAMLRAARANGRQAFRAPNQVAFKWYACANVAAGMRVHTGTGDWVDIAGLTILGRFAVSHRVTPAADEMRIRRTRAIVGLLREAFVALSQARPPTPSPSPAPPIAAAAQPESIASDRDRDRDPDSDDSDSDRIAPSPPASPDLRQPDVAPPPGFEAVVAAAADKPNPTDVVTLLAPTTGADAAPAPGTAPALAPAHIVMPDWLEPHWVEHEIIKRMLDHETYPIELGFSPAAFVCQLNCDIAELCTIKARI